MNFQVLVPPLADNILNVGASGFGFLMAASGVGSTVAALWVAFQRKPGPRPIAIGAITLGLGVDRARAVDVVPAFAAGDGASPGPAAIAMAVERATRRSSSPCRTSSAAGS